MVQMNRALSKLEHIILLAPVFGLLMVLIYQAVAHVFWVALD
jgi:hypothetical protein